MTGWLKGQVRRFRDRYRALDVGRYLGRRYWGRRYWALNLGFAAVSLAALALLYSYSQLMVPVAHVQEMFEVKVEKGESFSSAVAKFDEQGLIKDPTVFSALGRITGIDRRLIPGYYQFYGTIRPWDVFRMLREGKIVGWQFTVVEGDTLRIIKRKLADEGIVPEEEFDALVADPAFLEELGVGAPSLEGYLFPDTYAISKGATAREVIEMMVRRLDEVYDSKLARRAERMGLTRREVLTLASIIEKEAILDSERPVISGVYHNRLEIGMPLQADPTAVYGIKPMSRGVTRTDIRRRTDYNTYHIKGLPPGPICSPGYKSIRAALYPADVPYLYFVANFQGGHTFSVTLDEHISAIAEYKKKKYAAQLEDSGQVETQ